MDVYRYERALQSSRITCRNVGIRRSNLTSIIENLPNQLRQTDTKLIIIEVTTDIVRYLGCCDVSLHRIYIDTIVSLERTRL